MACPRIVLAGMGSRLEGLRWESDKQLRIGRQVDLDVVLRDYSVDRVHAEVQLVGARWVARNLAQNEKYLTLVNGQAVGATDVALKEQDLLQVGKSHLKVYALEAAGEPAPPRLKAAKGKEVNGVHHADEIKTSAVTLRVQAATHDSWDQALPVMAHSHEKRPELAMLTLLRANHRLSHLGNVDELTQSILTDAITTLKAQRGSIILMDYATGRLEQRVGRGPGLSPTNKCAFSRTLAERCFSHGESLLCRDVNADNELMTARSVKHGAMSSVICALLRSPRSRLGVMHLDRGPFQEPFDEIDLYLADAIAASVAIGIESAQLVDQQREQFIQAVTSLACSVEMRDRYTGDHTRRVTDYAILLADELKLSATMKYEIQVGTPLHDIGKIGVDDAILRKPGKLTADEFEAMKAHTIKGAAILQPIINFGPMIPIVRHHHERWDGSGYPDGLAKEQISQTARIVAVADAFDAMTSHRPYRPALPPEVAFFELLSETGKHFDPACVQAFQRLRPKVEAMFRQR